MWRSSREQSNGASALAPKRNVGSAEGLNNISSSGEPSASLEGTPRALRSNSDEETPTGSSRASTRSSPLTTPSIKRNRQHNQTPLSAKKWGQLSTPVSSSSQITPSTVASTPYPSSAVSSVPSTAPTRAPMPHYAYEDEDDTIQNRVLFQDDDNNDIDVSTDEYANEQSNNNFVDGKDDNDFLQRRSFTSPLHGNKKSASLSASPVSPIPYSDSDEGTDTIDTDDSPSSSPERDQTYRMQAPSLEPLTSDASLNVTRLRQGDRLRVASDGSLAGNHQDGIYRHDLPPPQQHRNRRSKSAGINGSGNDTHTTASSSGEPSSESESSLERYYTPSKHKDKNRRKKESRVRHAPAVVSSAPSVLTKSPSHYLSSYERSSPSSRRRNGATTAANSLPSMHLGQEQDFAKGKYSRKSSFGTSSAKGGKKFFRMSTFFGALACVMNVMIVALLLEVGPFTTTEDSSLRGAPTKIVHRTDKVASVYQAVSRHGRTIGGSKILQTVGKVEDSHKQRTQQIESSHKEAKAFDDLDILMYKGNAKDDQSEKKEGADMMKKRNAPRTISLYSSNKKLPEHPREIELYPAEFSDNTQHYSVLDSSDERLNKMEVREPLDDGECKPMQQWQTTFHPTCNNMHELDLVHIDDDPSGGLELFGTKGFWRNAWRVDVLGDKHSVEDRETIVLKTLKYNHNFEDAHYEHDRVDAVAMERLTASPHVIDIYDFCGHSVSTEYADGVRLGYLADKSKKIPLKRLEIARDIADGLADVHGIDGDGISGDGNTTFVHLDVNPANVVAVGGALKLNDFNIGILRRWNTTSNTHCGFPAQYPNPQWRSPEEARESQHLTEKVDIFSLGHIFFRLICGHEPWNKLEVGGKPSKEEMNEKVKKGVLPHIPHEIKESTDPEVIVIRDVMMQCYEYEPEKRPSAREIAKTLNSALTKLSAERKKKESKEKKAKEDKKKKDAEKKKKDAEKKKKKDAEKKKKETEKHKK